MESKRLYRSKQDRWIAGICGGIGEYFEVDPVIVRILFLVGLIGWGLTFWIYILLWVIIPENTE